MKNITIEVFRTGTHTDSEGNEKVWTSEEVQAIADTYNEAVKSDAGREAPIVKGHPETDAPAYGWVKNLFVADEILKADIELVDDFAEEVSDEKFKKVSIGLYDENLMLKHVGFLGAVQPAVKGLAPVKFSSAKSRTVDMNFEEAEPKQSVIESLIDSVKSLIKRFESPEGTKEYADVSIPVETLTKKQLENLVNTKLTNNDNSNNNFVQTKEDKTMSEWLKGLLDHLQAFVKENTGDEIAARFQSESDTYIQDNPMPGMTPPAPEDTTTASEPTPEMRAYAERINKLEKENRTMKFNQTVDGLDNIVPAQKKDILDLMEVFHSEKALTFSENGKNVTLTPNEKLLKVISQFPKQVTFGEQAANGSSDKPKVSSFAMPTGDFDIDESRNELHSKVLSYMEEQTKAGKNISYDAALGKVIKGGI